MDLTGTGILVTRPAHQAEGLCRRIEAAGGRALRYPVIAIEPIAQAPAPAAALRRADLAVFVSVNAVRELLRRLPPGYRWPTGLRVAAVGRATASALAAGGLVPDIVPAGEASSEGLLAEPALAAVAGLRVLIVRGAGGRELLADALRDRGAEVAYLELYRRVRPATGPGPLLRWWDEGVLDVATATSVEALENLVAMAGEAARARLLATPLVGASGRVIQRARELGFAETISARGAGDEALVAAVAAWHAARKEGR